MLLSRLTVVESELCALLTRQKKKKKKEKKKKKKTTEKVLLRCPVLARTWKACASKS